MSSTGNDHGQATNSDSPEEIAELAAPAQRRKGRPPASANDTSAKERIFQAALRLLRTEGPAGATVRAICSEADVTAPAVYHYYKDLDELYNDVLEWLFVRHMTKKPPDEMENPLGMIDDVWTTIITLAREEPGIIDLVNYQLSTGKMSPSMYENFGRLEKAFEQLAQTRHILVAPSVAAHAFWAGAHGLACLAVGARHGKLQPEAAIGFLKSTLLQGIVGEVLADADRPAQASG